MKLWKSLEQHPELAAQFIRRAAPETLSSELANWLRQQPELAGVYVPQNLAPYRRKLGCPAAKGGRRENRGKPLYAARMGPKKSVNGSEAA